MLRSAASSHITPTDAELLHRFLQTRDDEAFGRLVARHGEPVRRVAVRATGNPSAAEDVAQAAFIVLSRRPRAAWVSACCRGSALPWLVRTTRYAASSWRRTESRRRKHESAAAVPERFDASDPAALTEAVAAALSHMPRSERRLITLRYLDEKPWPDIAHQLGLTPEAARKAAARALVRLRERLRQQGIVVTPAALAIALATLSRPAHAAVTLAGTSSAFLIARGVLTMMKIKTAGLAGTALLATVMSVGALSVGAGGAPSADATNKAQSFTTGTLPGNDAVSDASDAQDANEQDDRPEEFKANEHQPGITLADGTRLTLLAISNGEDGWWHANGTRARAPRHYLPRGFGNSSISIASGEADSLLDMAFFVEPAADDDDGAAKASHAIELARVLNGEGKSPESTAIGINSRNGRQAWRVMIPAAGDAARSAMLCIATGQLQKVGEIRNLDGAWIADEGAHKWITIGGDDKKVFIELGKPGEESAAISVVAAGGEAHHGHGYVEGQRTVFEEHALDGVQRLEVYRRPLEVVRLANLAPQPDQAAKPRLELDKTPMVIMTGGHSVIATTEAGGHVQTTVQAGSGSGHAHAGSGGAHTTTIHGGSGGTTVVTGSGKATATTTGSKGHGGATAGGGSGANDEPKKPDEPED